MNQNHKLKFLINSNYKNHHVVLDKLIQSFYHQSYKDSLITNNDILVVLGGAQRIYFEKKEKYCVLEVPHNSIDFTALIAVIEHIYTLIDHNFSIPDYWFYLHDTCELGFHFLLLLQPHIQKLYKTNCNTKPLTYIKSMNIGIYKYNFLMNIKNNILTLRSKNNPSYEEIQSLKKYGVIVEDYIFYQDKDQQTKDSKKMCNSFMPNEYMDRTILGNPSIIYNDSNILRITEYFDQLDFYKYKANWELKETYLLDP
jgi:hypothetical protein